MKEGDILLYADSGCHLNKYGVKRLSEYCELAKKNKLPIFATVFGDEMPEYMWTKADTFNYFNCIRIYYTPENWLMPKYKVCDFSMSFEYWNDTRNLRLPIMCCTIFILINLIKEGLILIKL